MKSPTSSHVKRAHPGRGLTLVEVLVVLGLLGMAAGLSLLVGLDTIGRSVAVGERDVVVTFLETARAESLANIDESAHGLHIEGSSFVLFTGTTYSAGDPKNRIYARESTVSYTGPDDIVFEELSGAVSTGVGTLTFTNGGKSATIEVNEEGRINW